MHSGNIENYNFIHGLHRNMVNGKWFPLNPHTLGRALTHDEMDYNLLYSQQTIAGWRIVGENADLTLTDDQLFKSLIFWKIKATDANYSAMLSAGYEVGQYVWITPIWNCDDFYVSADNVTNRLHDVCEGFEITISNSTNRTHVAPTATPIPATPLPSATPVPTPVPTATPIPATFELSHTGVLNETNSIIVTLATTGVMNGTTVTFTLTGSATGVDYSASNSGQFTVQNNQAVWNISGTADNITEGNENIILTLAEFDSTGNSTNEITTTIIIVDTSLDPTPLPSATATPLPTATAIPATATPIPAATATPTPDIPGYFIHWNGTGGYPGVNSLTNPSTDYYLNDNSTTTNLDLIWSDMVVNQGTANNIPNIYTIDNLTEYTLSAQDGIPNGTIGFTATPTAQRYYFIIAQSVSVKNPVISALFELPDSSNALFTMKDRKSFNISGVPYWMYELDFNASTNPLNINIKP